MFGGDAQLFGDDLGVGGFVALPLTLRAEAGDGLAGGVDTNLARVEHLDAEDVKRVRRAGADDLGEGRDADAHQFAARPLLGLLFAQVPIADHIHRFLECGVIIAAVVFPTERRLVRELPRLDEVLHAEVCRVFAALVGQNVHHALDGVHRLGDPERTAVGDAAGGLVGVGGVYFDKRFTVVIRAGGDTE